MAVPDVTQKTEIYETLSGINLAFAAIVDHLQTMRQSGILRSHYGRVLQGLTHELRAEINVELLDKMNHIEMQDWTRYGKVRIKWEKYLRGPEPKRRKKR
jgi:predicted transcriptional regulator